MAKPIFIVGRHRSGTTWFSNLLAAHPDVYTPQHPDHFGQHESAYFVSLLPYCRWGRAEPDRRAIQAVFERSDYWRLLFPENPPCIDIDEVGVDQYFAQMMTEACQRRDAIYWIEKTPGHTLLLPYLMQAYPDAAFIAVNRNSLDTVRSNVYKFSNPKNPLHWIKAAVWTAIYRKILDRYCDRLLTITYEELMADSEATMARVNGYLGLSNNVNDCKNWGMNSSYTEGPPGVSGGMRMLVNISIYTVSLLPSAVCERFAAFWMGGRSAYLPKWFFRVYRGQREAVHD